MSQPLRVTVFDYGAGNLHSLLKTLTTTDTTTRVETDAARAVQHTDILVLPGVGAFAPAAERLAPSLSVVRAALTDGLPCLGICLGMQLLFNASAEGSGRGLGIFAGDVERLATKRVPQIGWNTIEPVGVCDPLLAQSELTTAYFANSFVARPHHSSSACVVADSNHDGDVFPAMVRWGNVVGTQFHPEKSSTAGVQFIHAFLAEARAARLSLVEAKA